MVTTDEDLCTQCGNPLLIIDDISEFSQDQSMGYQALKAALKNLTSEALDPSEVKIGMCQPCGVTEYFGPVVTVEGEVQ